MAWKAFSADLNEGKHFILNDGGRVVLGGDDFHQDPVDEVTVGNEDVKAVAAVLDTGFQDLKDGLKAEPRKKITPSSQPATLRNKQRDCNAIP